MFEQPSTNEPHDCTDPPIAPSPPPAPWMWGQRTAGDDGPAYGIVIGTPHYRKTSMLVMAALMKNDTTS